MRWTLALVKIRNTGAFTRIFGGLVSHLLEGRSGAVISPHELEAVLIHLASNVKRLDLLCLLVIVHLLHLIWQLLLLSLLKLIDEVGGARHILLLVQLHFKRVPQHLG
jgi:hypothetical protein